MRRAVFPGATGSICGGTGSGNMSNTYVAWLVNWQDWSPTLWMRLIGGLLVGVGAALARGWLTRRATHRHNDVVRAYRSGEYRRSFKAGRAASLALVVGTAMVALSRSWSGA